MTTPNYNLKKTELTNSFTQWISNDQDNLDAIDTALKNHDDEISEAGDGIVANEEAIIALGSSQTTHLSAPLPHKMLVDGVAYNYGFSQTDGFIKFIYEEAE